LFKKYFKKSADEKRCLIEVRRHQVGKPGMAKVHSPSKKSGGAIDSGTVEMVRADRRGAKNQAAINPARKLTPKTEPKLPASLRYTLAVALGTSFALVAFRGTSLVGVGAFLNQ